MRMHFTLVNELNPNLPQAIRDVVSQMTARLALQAPEALANGVYIARPISDGLSVHIKSDSSFEFDYMGLGADFGKLPLGLKDADVTGIYIYDEGAECWPVLGRYKGRSENGGELWRASVGQFASNSLPMWRLELTADTIDWAVRGWEQILSHEIDPIV